MPYPEHISLTHFCRRQYRNLTSRSQDELLGKRQECGEVGEYQPILSCQVKKAISLSTCLKYSPQDVSTFTSRHEKAMSFSCCHRHSTGAIAFQTRNKGAVDFLPGFGERAQIARASDHETIVIFHSSADHSPILKKEEDCCVVRSHGGHITVGVSGIDRVDSLSKELGLLKRLGALGFERWYLKKRSFDDGKIPFIIHEADEINPRLNPMRTMRHPILLSSIMSPAFPPEITDHIISFVWPAKQALCCCALTCRAWLPASRYYLFNSLRIDKRSSFDSLVHLVLHQLHMRPYFDFVRDLHIWEDKRSPLAHLILHLFAAHLHNLETLHFALVNWKVVPLHPSFFTLVPRLTGVTKLALRGCNFSSFREFQRLVCALPRLDNLVLCNVEWDVSGPSTIWSCRSGRPRLVSLAVNKVVPEHFVVLYDWLCHTPSVSTIQSFEISRFALGCSSAAFQGLLQSLKSSLQHLDVPVLTYEAHFQSLASNINLRSIAIQLIKHPISWPDVARMLSHLTTRQLQKVTLEVSVFRQASTPIATDDGDALATGLNRVDEILSSEQFARLDLIDMHVTLDRNAGMPPNELHSIVEGRLHRLHARGILRLTHMETRLWRR
ncbi:hypothetical protein A0H81_06415 [Grifola frondosa]|uniref:F-box domain-containing protein n=1 Tax=Grifola frondosa TaxID=5627 RepID=A0A1C7MBD2_GRIFR|nr:hypothetical protein A0H81_06415 [Grifola frondosa]